MGKRKTKARLEPADQADDQKSAENSAIGRDQKGRFVKGNPQGPGRGCAKGAPNAGRPPQPYVEWCREVLRDPKVERQVQQILRNKNHKHFAAMLKHVSERAHGKPVQPLSAPDGGALIPDRIVVELVTPQSVLPPEDHVPAG